ncbi:amino acid adenylation domain-containing protein [Streptomyces zhaozhouensis]|uniref:Amino acid adenylation domain-containing protein n=1 Tax=Streptomyces zhaozhouensis TaxID=1300267 RepID=A0A286DZN8_9ACTN|nr:non-ribosomal peptide synthetase [Streptomyces zhaozhouensis]SOD64138.1 amino acid adenylation domain-containing protein [Streptomyces zhaozhouensis]
MGTSSTPRAELLRQRLRGLRPAAPETGISAVARTGPPPLSFAQRRLWVLDRLTPGDTQYLMPLRLRLPGTLDEAALRRALDELPARHEVLRTRYREVDGEPVQWVDAPGPLPLTRVDVGRLPADEARARVDALVAEDGDRPFDLAAEWPVRALLVREPDAWTLLLTCHHIASDGWSEGLLLGELDALYGAFAAGEPSPLEPPPVQYADFALWQRGRLEGPVLDRQLDYWGAKLVGLTPLALPLDRPRAPLRDGAGATEVFEVPATVATRLAEAGGERGATPFMVLLAVFKLLLSRHCGQRDVVVGSPVAGRERAETQTMPGLFTNTVVLRTDLAGATTFPDLLERVRETALGAFTHQETPFERLVETLAPERDPSRNPLFQVVFQYAAAGETPLPRLGGTQLPVASRTAKFDLGLALAARPDGSLVGQLEYATALFDAPTVRRLVGHYRRLLSGVADDPLAPVDALPMLGEEERRLLREWSGAGASFPAERSLPEVFRARAAMAPDAVAVRCAGESLSYAELDARSDALAGRLRAGGVGGGDLVGVCLPRGAHLVVALLGVLKSGAGYVPLDPGLPAGRLAFVHQDAGLAAVVTERRLLGVLPADGREPLLMDEEDDSDDGWAPSAAPPPPPGPDEVAYVIYTSGSTGRPKGVAVTHANVLRLLLSCQEDFGFGADDVWTLFHSYAFDFSVWELWGPLLTGGRVVVVPFDVSRSPRDLLRLLAEERVTVLNQTPSAFRWLTEAAVDGTVSPDRLALRTVVFGGEALDMAELAPWYDWWQRAGVPGPELVNMYGITETTVHVTRRPLLPAEAVEAARTGRRHSPIGRPLADLRVRLLDEALREVPIGVPGELYVSGPGLARGYLHRPALTADRFPPDPRATAPGARMYRTGDLARFRADGELEYLGRVDEQVKIRGHRVEPGEIEAALASHPELERAVVLAHTPAGEREARLVAYVVPTTERVPDVAELRAHLGRWLPAYLVPAVFVPVAGIPLTGNGKTDRAALPSPEDHRALPAGGRTAPRDAVEEAMARGFAEALDLPEVGVHDNFFALGGDSIRAIRVVGALRRAGVELTVQELLSHQTVGGITAARRGAAPAAGDSEEERRVAPFALLAPEERAALPPGVVDAYPLSMVQAAMVYQMLADGEDSPYHNVTLFPMADDAPFDLAALRAAAALLAERHEILRTRFDLTTFREPVQLVGAEGAVEVGHTDLRGLSEEEVRKELRRFVADTRNDPFDVTRAPMVRFHALRTGEDRWTFAFVECHAVLDGWSHHSLIDELLTDYRALREGRAPGERPAHTVRFADYVARERRSLASAEDREFWRDRLERFDRVELPPSWAADPAAGEEPYQLSVDFADLEPGLRRLASAASASLKSVLLTAHLKVLSVVGGTRAPRTGLVCNGRLETEGGELVRGMHLNTLPFAVELTGADWRTLVRRVLAEEAALWPHRRFPLPEMQRAWGAGTPLVDVAFTYLDFHVLDDRRIESAGVVDVSPNEFGLDVWTFPGRLYVSARPERLGRAHGRRLLALYRRVLEAMAADPAGDARGSLLDPEEERRLAGHAWGRSVDYPELCVHELFERQVARTPDAVALRAADGSTVSYAELNARANRLARRLRARGVGVESRVGVLLRRGPDLVVALLAVLKAGAAYLPLDPAHPAARLATLLREADARLVLTEPGLTDRLAGSPARPLSVEADGESGANLGATASPEALAYLVYTSGSTGTPKGVMVEHRNLVNYICWCLDAYRPLRGTGSPLYSSMAFDLPVTSLFPALLSGQPVTLTEDDGTPGVDALVQALEKGGFGLLKLSPAHLALLNRSLSPEGVRRATGRLIAGGDELVRDMVSRWARHSPETVVDNEYGPTETTVGCSHVEAAAGELESGVLPIGRPVSNTVMRVLDADLAPVPVGVVGELYLGGAQLTRGYVGRPELTAERYVPDPYATRPGQRLYRSGDLARHREDGVLEFAGRVDDQVKVRGHRVEIGEVEAALHRHAELRDAVVRLVTMPSGERELVSYLVPADGVVLDPVELDARLATELPAPLIPAGHMVLDALPMTPSGKIDTRALPEPTGATVTTAYRAPRTAVENVLARAWARVLGVPRVGVDDEFAALGGNSMTVMRVIVALREEHGLSLTFRSFYEHRTVAELARAVTGAGGDGVGSAGHAADAVVWLRREGSRPPLFCVHPGSAHWFAQLAAHLDEEQPVAAFEWPGLTRECPAPESVGAIAELNLAQLRRIAPNGPYRLLGWCGGSQITSEMVRRLREAGEDVTFVLLDPALDSYERENMREFMARFREAEALLAELAEAGEERVPALRRRAAEVLEVIVDDGTVDPPVPGDPFWPSRVRVWRELLQTRLDYRHRPCPGPLHLIAGDELAAGDHEVAFGQSFDDYTGRWSELATGGLTVHRVAGTHLGVLRAPHVAEVARTLTGLLAHEGRSGSPSNEPKEAH